MNKSMDHLTPEDFRTSPIWEPVDDLEDPNREVRPLIGHSLHLEEIYFVAANVKLADGSVFEGYIRLSWGKPRQLALAISDSRFCVFALGIQDESGERHGRFAAELGRSSDHVFPLEYRTSVELQLRGEAM